jgi:hypothetical protein
VSTVRMARKSLIGFAEGVLARLDSLQAKLLEPAVTIKKNREERARHRAEKHSEPARDIRESDDKSGPLESHADEFGHAGTRIVQSECDESKDQACSGFMEDADAGTADEPQPPSKRLRVDATKAVGRASLWDVEQLLNKLMTRIGGPLQSRPLSACRRHLVNLMAIPDLGQSPHLCRDAVEGCLCTVQASLETSPPAEVLGRLLWTLQSIEGLANPEGLSAVVVGLVNTTADL